MIMLVCGGRNYADREFLYEFLDSIERIHGQVDVLIEGGAKGADSLASEWATEREIDVDTYFAKWDMYGKFAGPARNQRMLTDGKPDLVVCFPGGRGTANMKAIALEAGVQVVEAGEES